MTQPEQTYREFSDDAFVFACELVDELWPERDDGYEESDCLVEISRWRELNDMLNELKRRRNAMTLEIYRS